jgi:hypothetical protein
MDYLNRSILLPLRNPVVEFGGRRSVSFPTNAVPELIGGKLKALTGRVVIRDLFDISNIASDYNDLVADDPKLARRVILYYLSISEPFPRPFTVATRFAKRDADIDMMLVPVLNVESPRPVLAEMIETAEEFLKVASTPIDGAEEEYWDRAAKADFAPEVLFAEYPFTLEAARNDPTAKWKMRNLAGAVAG